MALVDLKREMVCHTNITPFWIAVCQESETQICTKLILHEFFATLHIISSKFKDKNGERPQLEITPYSAPEIRNMQEFGIEADIWSLGAVFYEMIFGSLQGIIISAASVTISFPQSTPQWLQSFFKKTLSFNPTERYAPKEILQILKPAMLCA